MVAEFDWLRQRELELAAAEGNDALHLPSAMPYRKRWGSWGKALLHFGYDPKLCGTRLSSLSLPSLASVAPRLTLDCVEFPVVHRSHIVPRTYLRRFADGERIAMRLVGESETRLSTVGNVAVRKDFYVRHRRDGSEIHDIEWSMAHSENAVAPVLREIEDRWPLTDRDKTTLGEFTALQLLRTPRFREWHEQFINQTIDEMRTEEGLKAISPDAAKLARPDDVDRLGEHMKEDTQRHVRMLGLLNKVGSILTSMHWTLLRFDKPLVVTSDHPVHVWPIECPSSRPRPTRTSAGMLQTLEVRLPVSSHVALVMSWWPAPDPSEPTDGARHHPKNLNAFTVAEAEKAWFFLPETSPPVGNDVFLPISTDLFPGYDAAAALRSPLRQQVSRLIQPKIGEELHEEMKFEIIRVRDAAA